MLCTTTDYEVWLAKDDCAVTKRKNFVFNVRSHSARKNHGFQIAAFAREICNVITMCDSSDVLGDDWAFI
jgi:hypothetical protein